MSEARTDGLIDGAYRVNPTRLADAGGGLIAHAATDMRSGRGDLMAVLCPAGVPPRAREIAALRSVTVTGVLTPLAHGVAPLAGREEAFVICAAPPGPSLAAPRAWTEAALIGRVLRPAALALRQLQALGVTHRAIRPGNVFQAGPDEPAVLGAAWAAPPGSLEPAVFEPPPMMMCGPDGRGDGGVADDVYALGVLLLTLATGRVPRAGEDAAEIVARALDHGNFAALAGGERLSPALAEILRGMLADDPEHRPSPALLLDPTAVRTRRVPSRPPMRAAQPLDVGGREAWHPRALAHALATRPEPARAVVVRSGLVVRWLRRHVGDATLAARVEEAARPVPVLPGSALAQDPETVAAMAMLRVIAVLDPLAPVIWRGLAWFPDGFGPAFAAAIREGREDAIAAMEQAVMCEASSAWASCVRDSGRQDRDDPALARAEERRRRTLLTENGDPEVGRFRLCHGLNPLLPCGGAVPADRRVIGLRDLLPALEYAAAGQTPPERLVDPQVVGFAAARNDPLGGALPAGNPTRTEGTLAALRLLASVQARTGPASLPAIAGWFAARAEALTGGWRNRARRIELGERLRTLSEEGRLDRMLDAVEDEAGREADARAAAAAAARVREIDAVLAARPRDAAIRAAAARRVGQDLVMAAGAAALAAAMFGVLAGPG